VIGSHSLITCGLVVVVVTTFELRVVVGVGWGVFVMVGVGVTEGVIVGVKVDVGVGLEPSQFIGENVLKTFTIRYCGFIGL
jgi:hypothetical protein